MRELLAAFRYLSNNHAQIQASTVCGCCACMQVFPPQEIVAWSGLQMDNLDDPKATDAQTALCPRCGSEAVLGDKAGFPIQPAFLARMHEAWFQRTIIARPGAKK